MDAEKTCSKCGVTHQATPQFFYRDPNHSDGLRSECRECRLAYHRSRRPPKRLQSSTVKRCNVCGQERPATAEFFTKRGPALLRGTCKDCCAKQRRARTARVPRRQHPDIGSLHKRCSRCNEIKPRTNEFFYSHPDGLQSRCKPCASKSGLEWAHNNPDKNRSNSLRDYYKNRERRLAATRARRLADPEKSNRQQRETYQRHREKRLAKCSTPEGRAKSAAYQRGRRQQTEHRLHNIFRSRLSTAAKTGRAGKKFEERFGYSLAALKRHIELQFIPGMSWDNYGTFWEIDHRIPLSHFKFPEEIKACWALTNLQPMSCSLNRSKSDKSLYLL